MEQEYAGLRRTITWMAISIAVLTALLLPGGYAYTALTYEGARLESIAERLGTFMSTQAYLFPNVWRFQASHLSEVHFAMRYIQNSIDIRILDAQDTVLHQIGALSSSPILSRVAVIHDGTQAVGRVEVAESVRSVWYRTGLLALGSTVLALGIFAVLRLLPFNALRRALQELAVSQRDLLRVHEELRRQERLAAVGQMTAMVNHELRNPLGSIRTSLFTIRRLVGPQHPVELHKTLDIADRSITRCDAIIGDLLNFTRHRQLYYTDVALDEWLATILAAYVMPPDISLHQNLTAGATVTLDQDRLQRVVINVLDNACQALRETTTLGPERPRHITVTTQAMELQVTIGIEDHGPGMAPEVLERIFEPLYSTKGFGVGLGLPIVKQIIEQHGGSVAVHSTPGHSTYVLLSLPRRPSGQAGA